MTLRHVLCVKILIPIRQTQANSYSNVEPIIPRATLTLNKATHITGVAKLRLASRMRLFKLSEKLYICFSFLLKSVEIL